MNQTSQDRHNKFFYGSLLQVNGYRFWNII